MSHIPPVGFDIDRHIMEAGKEWQVLWLLEKLGFHCHSDVTFIHSKSFKPKQIYAYYKSMI